MDKGRAISNLSYLIIALKANSEHAGVSVFVYANLGESTQGLYGVVYYAYHQNVWLMVNKTRKHKWCLIKEPLLAQQN